MDYALVHIKWLDSASYPDQCWHLIENHEHSVIYIDTVGYVIYEDEQVVTLAMNISTVGHMIGDMTIPKSCILERNSLDA